MCKPRQNAPAGAADAPTYLFHRSEVVEVCPDIGTVDCTPVRKALLQVLVVEDHRDSADMLSMLLQMWGHEVRVAYSGNAALELTVTYQPDVMLLDVAMPGMDGYQLAQQLRRQERFMDTLLIATTGYADEAHCLRGAAAGFDQYLIKPLDLESLEDLLLRERRRLTASSATRPPSSHSEARPL